MSDSPQISGFQVRPVVVPLNPPLRTASGVMAKAPLVLVDISTNAGVTGSAYIFTYTPVVLQGVVEVLKNLLPQLESAALAPRANLAELRRKLVLIGTPGLLDMALAAIDMALWDAHARFLNAPLSRVLGGTPSRTLAYASFGMERAEDARPLIAQALDAGFRAIKIKIGYPTLAEDLAAVRAARALTGERASLMIDYNQSLSVPEAIRRCQALDDEGLAWIEEPTRCDDFAGHARIAEAVRTPLQLGENLYGPREVRRSIGERCSDLMMLDLMKVGGISGWMDAAGICAAAGVPVSNHFFQEASAHLLGVTPTAHYLEYFGIADAVLADTLEVVDGHAVPSQRPGIGITWNEAAVRRFAA